MKTTNYYNLSSLLTGCTFLICLIMNPGYASGQCDTEVSGVFTYCNAVGTPGTTGYFVAFRVKDLTGDTLNVVDLNGNNVTNRGKRVDDINVDVEPATVTITPLMISGVAEDTLEFWYFGPYPNGSTFDIALVDPNNECDTIFVASGSYDCMDNTGISDPMACDNDVPLYFLDFSQTEFTYGGGGGGNENLDELFLIMQRTRESVCCDISPANQRCFEFIVRLGDLDIGLALDDVGAGATAGEFYADTLNMFTCTGDPATTWPFTQSGGQSSDLPLCLEGGAGQEFVVLSCKSGGNVTGVSVDALSVIYAPPQTTIQPCNAALEVFNADTVMWSSNDDPGLDNLISCNGDSTICEFFYDSLTFGQVTACEGDTFVYFIAAMPADNACSNLDTTLYDTTFVVVYPLFDVVIDSTCDATGDSLILTAEVFSAAMGCEYSFNWSTGDTTQSITVPFSTEEFIVTVTRADLPPEAQNCVSAIDSIMAEIVSCDNITDTLYSCLSQLPEPDTTLVGINACGGFTPLIFTLDIDNGGSGCLDDTLIITRYYIVDFDGDTLTTTNDQDSCVQRLLFADDIAPALEGSCPPDTAIACSVMNLDFLVPPVYSDNCTTTGDIIITFRDDTLSGFTGLCNNDTTGTVRRVWFAQDTCGNIDSTCFQFIFYVDTLGPQLVCPADITVSCNDSTLPENTGSATASDNCVQGDITGYTDSAITGTCPSSFIRTWTAMDLCGNVSSCIQTITFDDTVNPTITCPANVTVQCASLVPVADPASVITSDNCGGTVVVTHDGDVISNMTCANRFTITRTYSATDACGNTATCNQIITVFDNTAPAVTCPANVTIQCASLIPAVDPSSVTTTDNCGGTATVTHVNDVITNMTCANRFNIVRTYLATDACGNTATCTQSITVFDSTPPSITCPANITVQCASLVPAADITGVVASDNCGGTSTVTFIGDVISNMTCTNRFNVTRTYQATDACGNSSTCSQTITVFDNIAPTLTCPANVTVQCASLLPAPNTSSVIVNDNCSGVIFVTVAPDVISNMTCADRFTVTRVYTATDACGNSATCAQVLTVFDDMPPTITCPANVTVQCASLVPAANIAAVTATDNCGGTATITHTGDAITNMTCTDRFIVTRTYLATDACGNTTTCSQTITVFDDTAPSITCPPNVTIDCEASTLPANTGTATATDNCNGVPTITSSDGVTGGSCPAFFVRTWLATDGCGNTATCTQTISLDDNTAPTITCPANITVQCDSSTLPADTGMPTGSDNCDLVLTFTPSDVTIAGTCPQEYTINRTWTATDDCGNTATCLQVIAVEDTTPPLITCPADLTVQCATEIPITDTESIVASDNCGIAIVGFISDITISGGCPNQFTVNRTYQATDLCGNTTTCVQTIVVFDDTPPMISCPANVTVQCASLVPAANMALVTATDNCGGIPTIIHTGDVVTNMTCADRFTITRTYQATDACGNTATCAQIITVFDDTAPSITCPANVTVQCASLVPVVNVGSVSTSDNCGGIVTVTHLGDATSNMTCADRFTITRTYQATDACGNTATCAQIITVFDNTIPSITCPANITVQCASLVPAPNPAAVVSSDNCGGTTIITAAADVISNMTCTDRFTITRVYTATDACGNTATCAQIITVFDDTTPAITCPANITVACANLVPAPNTGSVVSSDNCGGTVTITHVGDVTSNMTCPNNFIVTRTYRATDACGNSSTCNQVITVSDITPPSITCPANITINFEESTAPANTGTPTGSDNCGGVPVFTSNDVTIAGMCSQEYTIQRTWTATDLCGNTATCLQIIELDGGCMIDLSLTKDLNGNQGNIVGGDNVTFTITVTNESTTPIGSVTITDYIPTGFTLNDPDWIPGTAGSTGQSASITLSVANGGLPPGGLTAGQSVLVEITLQADPDILPGEYFNTAEISAVFDLAGNDISLDDLDSNPDENDLNDPDAEDDHDVALICVLPLPAIIGDNFVCPGETVTYFVDVYNPNNTYTFILQNGGGQIISTTDSSVTILWQDEPGGAFVIQLNEIAGPNCQATVFLNVFIQGDDALACNDHVNISIDEDCEFVLLSGMILEGELFGDDNYIVIIIDQNGDTVPNATLTFEHIGQTFTVKVMSECTNNSCWGTITVEDKLPPQIICSCPVGNPEPDPNCEITCLDVEQLVAGNIPDDLQPEVIDNCGGATIDILDTQLNFDNCEGGFILVTWVATDIAGNTATCVQEFTIIPLTLDSLEFPVNYEGECGTSVHPDVTGWPQIDGIDLNDEAGLCNIFTGYWDKELAECGGGRKIVRTWTVLDWCTVELVEFVQIIKLTDTEGPVLTCPPDLTVGTDFWYCFANVSVPKPIATDNCSDITTFVLLTSSGEVISFGNNFVINGLLIGSHDVTWVVSDECGNSSSCSFTITVVDDVVPVANCDHHTVVSLTNDGPFGITLVPADVFDDGSYDNCGPVTFRARRMDSCIDFDWTTEGACIDHIPGGIPPVNSRDRGTVHRPCVPFACCDVGEGPIMVELEVTDAAGNVNYCMVEVTVQDKISPFVECPPDIIVSCEFWFAFEEGTFTDAEGNNNGSLDEDPLSAVFGNMFDAFRHHESVRESIIINDPGNHQFAQPHFWGIDGWADDNCEVNLSVRVRLIDDCSGDDLPANAPPGAVRLIERRFSASDGNDGIAPGTCTQRIWVVDFEPFFITDNNCNNSNPNDGVIWPCDVVLTTCPDDLSGTGEPIVFDDACSLIGVAYEDTRFNFVDGACFKILRKWSVIDWCQYDPFTGEGLWMYTQVIKVNDHEGPAFVDCPQSPVVLCVADPGVTLPDNNQAFLGEDDPLSSSCSAHLNLCKTVIETCSEFVKYDVKIYPFNGSSFIQVKSTTIVPVDTNSNQAVLCFNTRESTVQSVRLNGIPYNSPWCGDYHRILWSVEDDCGNLSFCEYLFRLEDCKQPSPVCINGLSSVVMPSSGQVTIWAKDFDASSFDDCTPAEELLYSFDGDSYQPSFTYTCDNVPVFGVEITQFIWVADGGVDENCNGKIEWSERNKDFCTTTIVIQDNENACDTMVGSILTGDIMTPNGDPVSPVIVSLSGVELTYPDEVTTSTGHYVFDDVLTGYDYVVKPERNDHHKNGVSTIDLVRIQKHLLGLESFSAPYQYIAADANNSEHVSAIDLIEIRKLILGVYTEFPRNQSWRFVDNAFEFPDPMHPWPFKESISLTNVQGDISDNDFTGIKIGDVNGSAKSNATQILPRESRRMLTIPASFDEISAQGELIKMKLIIPEALIGFQWTLETEGLDFVDIHSDQISIGDQHVGVLSDGVITMSWHHEVFNEPVDGQIVINVTWRSSNEGSGKSVKLTNKVTAIEGYTTHEEILDLELDWDGRTASEFALYQNEPNPWNAETIIGFELPEASDATLTIFDVTGKMIKTIEGIYPAGKNSILVRHQELPGAGILYYRLESKGYTASKKMTLIR